MRHNVEKYLSKNGEINSHAYPTEERTENGILNTAKYIFALLASREIVHDISSKILGFHHLSHDNITASVYLQKRSNSRLPISFVKDPERKYHPRSTIFWAWASKPNLINYLGLTVVCVANLFTCLRSYKIRNGNKIVKSDNEMLMILMYRAGLKDVWFCRCVGFIFHKLLVRRFGKNIYSGIINHWYKHDNNHPVKLAWREIPEDFRWWR